MNRARIIWIVLTSVAVVVVGSGWLWAQGGPQPAFGPLLASPPNFVFNTPATVKFTILIDTPTLNPTTVELQRVDATGKMLARVGGMLNNGQSGDAKAGDKIFTAVVQLNEPQIGRLYFRVAAAFRGNQQNAQSAIVPVDVDPFKLPPDPGEAGKQTVQGLDSDRDGVRDDVQRYVALKYMGQPLAAEVLYSYSRASQALMTATNAAAIMAANVARTRAAACWNYRFRSDDELSLDDLRIQIVNTDERFARYLEADRALGGRIYKNLSRTDASVCLP